MKKPRLYIENPEHTMPRHRVSDEVHEQALRRYSQLCADIVIIDRGEKKFYLVERRIKPMAGWWWSGGGIFAGEPEDQAARRIFKRETGFDMSLHRFEFVDYHRVIWKDRQEEPQDAGRDDATYLYAVDTTPAERAIMAKGLDRDEFNRDAGLTGFNAAELRMAKVSPIVIDMYNLIFPPE